MVKITKILISIFCIIIFQTQLKAEEELGSQHTVGLGFLYSYEYSEPYLMHLRAGLNADDDKYSNIGFLFICIIGLGILLVSGFNRSPFPPQRINAFILFTLL